MAEKRERGGGKASVVVSMAQGARELARKRLRRDDPPPHHPRNGVHARKWAGDPNNWTPNDLGLPTEDPCPVEPLGIEGDTYHFIDSSRQFRSMTASELSHAGMQSLFAATPNWPQWAFPRHGKVKTNDEGKPLPPAIESFKDDHVRGALMLACTREGLFSPTDKMRGRGAWRLRTNKPQAFRLIYHAGEELWLYEGTPEKGQFLNYPTGQLALDPDKHLYPRLAELPAPWPAAFAAEENPAGVMLQNYRCWNWSRPDVDPILMLGHDGVKYLGGALSWRSAVLLLGDKGTGKSTLQNMQKELFGPALLTSANTTAAGIYQQLAHDTRPVAVDELEPGANQRKVDDLVALMRQSASGDFARRGSADHQAIAFQMRSAFIFSAINNPLHEPADLSRVAVLRLRPFDGTQQRPPAIDADRYGPMILARLMRQWGEDGARFFAALDAFKAALAAGGHDARGQETYGTLLACAELMLGPELGEQLGVPLSEDPGYWAKTLSIEQLPEVESARANWRKCFEYLLAGQVDVIRSGARPTVGQVLEDVAREEARGADCNYGREEARRHLGTVGLGLIAPGERDFDSDTGWILAVPNDARPTAKLFEDSAWFHGGWADALRQCPHDGIVLTDKKRNRVPIPGLGRQRCTLVVLRKFHEAPERLACRAR